MIPPCPDACRTRDGPHGCGVDLHGGKEHSHAHRSIPIRRIKAAAYNPRIDLQPGDPDYERLKRSMDEFGFVEPLIWNRRTGNLVGGHQRLKILAAQGAKRVEVSVVDLPLEREQALNIALNKISGEWDERKLVDLLTGLAQIPDFDVGLTGFDATEVTQLLDKLEALGGEDDFDLADALESAEDHPPITEPGELIELGCHRLLCGDSAKSEEIARLLDGHKVDLAFCDPPYNVSYYGGQRPTPHKARPKRSRSWQRIYMDDLDQDEYEAWLGGILQNMLAQLAPGAPFYIWNGHRQFGPMHSMLTAAGAHVSCVLTWAKESFAIGYGDYSQQTEFCMYGWRARGKNANQHSAHRWYTKFAFESNQFQSLLADELRRRSQVEGLYLQVESVHHATDKLARIQSLQPLVRSGILQFSRRHTVLLEQLRLFPKAAHDDGPDALEMAVEAARTACGPISCYVPPPGPAAQASRWVRGKDDW